MKNDPLVQILAFDAEISLKIDREFLKDCFYHKYSLEPSERSYLLALKQKSEIALFKIQHVVSILDRLENKFF